MALKKNVTIVTIAVTLIFTGVIVGWHLYVPRSFLDIQAPGADKRPEGSARGIGDVLIGEYFQKYDDAVSNLDGKWIRFRGKNSDNIVLAPETLNLSNDDYDILWTVETGEGYAGPVIYNGRLYLLDYIESMSSDALRCFDLLTGTELWRRWYRVPMRRNHGFSRTVPAIGEEYIITIGPMGHVMSCDPITGELKWSLDMQQKYNSVIPMWFTGQCPLVEDNTVILAPAGDSILLAGYDVHSGNRIWSTPNTPNFAMSHSSVMPITINGKKMYVYVSVGGICGVSAEEADRGALLWSTSDWRASVAVASPVLIANNRIFVTAGYGVGSAVLQIDGQGNRWSVSVVQQFRPIDGLSSEQQTPIFHNNMLIATLPRSAGAIRERLTMYAPSNLRTPVWTSEPSDVRSFYGPYMVINNHVFLFTEDGELFVYEILQQSMRLVKRQRVMDGVDAFGPMAYADGILVLGDAHTIKALKIAE